MSWSRERASRHQEKPITWKAELLEINRLDTEARLLTTLLDIITSFKGASEPTVEIEKALVKLVEELVIESLYPQFHATENTILIWTGAGILTEPYRKSAVLREEKKHLLWEGRRKKWVTFFQLDEQWRAKVIVVLRTDDTNIGVNVENQFMMVMALDEKIVEKKKREVEIRSSELLKKFFAEMGEETLIQRIADNPAHFLNRKKELWDMLSKIEQLLQFNLADQSDVALRNQLLGNWFSLRRLFERLVSPFEYVVTSDVVNFFSAIGPHRQEALKDVHAVALTGSEIIGISEADPVYICFFDEYFQVAVTHADGVTMVSVPFEVAEKQWVEIEREEVKLDEWRIVREAVAHKLLRQG